jgi:hypothetical protein
MKVGNVRVNRAGMVMAVVVAALVLVGASVGKGGKKTHFGVPPSLVVNISTESVPNNNAGGANFYYDRNTLAGPFTVPEGYSFVVTDIFIEPADLNAANDYLVVVGLNTGESRSMSIFALEPEQRHVAFSGAMIMSSGTPTARNTTFSTTACDVRILGYFVKGEGLDGGESPFPAE